MNRKFHPEASLSKREIQVLEAVALGYSVKEISAMLGVRQCTVASHIANIKTKTGCQKNTELSLIWFCRQSGISVSELIRKRLLPVLFLVSLTLYQCLSGQEFFRSSRAGRRGRKNETELII